MNPVMVLQTRLALRFPELVEAHGLEFRRNPMWARKTSEVTHLPAGEVSDDKLSVGLWSTRSETTDTTGETYFIHLSYQRRSRRLAEPVKNILLAGGAERAE